MPDPTVPHDRVVEAVPMSGVAVERVEYLGVPLAAGRVPLGMITLLGGDPGLGKSLLTCHLAAEVSRCGGAVLLASAEDSYGAVVRPRLEVSDANLDLVHYVRVRLEADDLDGDLTLPDDVAQLSDLVAHHAAKLVVIDPLMAHLPDHVNSWRDQSMRRALSPLNRLAGKQRCAVVVVVHLNKAPGNDPLRRTGGSVGIPAAVRSALLLARDPDDPDGESGSARVLAHWKCNVAPLAPSLSCQVEAIDNAARLVIGGETHHSGRDLLTDESADDRRIRTGAATEWLKGQLTGPRPSAQLKAAAKAAGHAWRTVQRARDELGVEVTSAGFPKQTTWALPGGATKDGATATDPARHDWPSPLPDRDCEGPSAPVVPSQFDGTTECEAEWQPYLNGADPDLKPEPHWPADVRDELARANIAPFRARAADTRGWTVGASPLAVRPVNPHTERTT